MSIGAGLTLVTGPTGSGKTCVVVEWLSRIKDRPIFSMGITDLAIEHQMTPPVAEWTEMRPSVEDPSLLLPYFTFPAGAVVAVDECQRVFRPRNAASKVPPEVAAFETRRHTGVDFVLITQVPTLLDANVRKLVTRHIHIHDTFLGRYMLEWVGCGDPDNKASRELATRTKYSPPKSAFGLYKSAELHTKLVRKYPWYMWLFLIALPLAIGLAYYSLHRIGKRVSKSAAGEVQAMSSEGQGASAPRSQGQGQGGRAVPVTAAEYVAAYTPRLPGLQHTAPAYDDLTKPQDVPVITGCIVRKKTSECKCYDQQGNTYKTSPEICKTFMSDGIFIPWRKTEIAAAASKSVADPVKVAQSSPDVRVDSGSAATYKYGSQVGSLEGGSHNFAGGLSVSAKPAENVFTIKPAG